MYDKFDFPFLVFFPNLIMILSKKRKGDVTNVAGHRKREARGVSASHGSLGLVKFHFSLACAHKQGPDQAKQNKALIS